MIALRARRRAVRLARSILYPPFNPADSVKDDPEPTENALPRLYPVIDRAALLRRSVLVLLGGLLIGSVVLGYFLASELLH